MINADTTTVEILGHTFTRMTSQDYQGFAGTGPNAFIAHRGDFVTLIFEPQGNDGHSAPTIVEMQWDEYDLKEENTWELSHTDKP